MSANLFGDPNTVVNANTIASIAALRGINSSTNTFANVLGYYTTGDGGGGDYRIDPLDVSSVDNGGTIIVAADGGRWKLIHRGVVDAAQFGVSTTLADNSARFQAFMTAAGNYTFRATIADGTYNFTSATTTFPLPADNGTTAPVWHGSGDIDIAGEVARTMPVCINIPAGVVFEGESKEGVKLTGTYNITAGAIDITQNIFMCLGTDLLSYWTGSLRNFTISNFFIGGVGLGVTYRSTFKDIKFSQVAIPWNGQNSEGATEWDNITMETCYAGLTQGGRWLQRNRTSFDTAYIPPYPAADVQLLGWCDNTYWNRIEYSSGVPYDSRAAAIDTFFDTYFYKSANSAVYPAGRASVNSTAGEFNGNGTYRGIVGFPVKVMSRYGRFSAGLHANKFVTNNHCRSAFYADFMSNSFIGNFYSEVVGFAAGGQVFGTTVPDPWHAGQPVGFGVWVDQGDTGNTYGHMGAINSAAGLTSGQAALTDIVQSLVTFQKQIAAQGGIDFAAGSYPAGMTGHSMGDYQEGTWTPADASGAGLTFTGNFRYIKIGRLVFVFMNIIFPATGNGNTVTVSGLPFSPALAGTFGWAEAYTTSNLTATWTYNGTNQLTMRSLTGANILNSQMSGQTTTGCFMYSV